MCYAFALDLYHTVAHVLSIDILGPPAATRADPHVQPLGLERDSNASTGIPPQGEALGLLLVAVPPCGEAAFKAAAPPTEVRP